MVSCSWFSETAEFQEKEALDVCLLWASVQVLSQRKSPWQLSGSPRVAVFLFAEWKVVHLGNSAILMWVPSLGICGCWRRQWHPTPVLLPGKSHGRRSLMGCSPWGHKSQTRLGDFTFTFHFPALEREMATHSSVLAWRIPGTGEPGGLPSMGPHRIGHDWSDLAAAAVCICQSQTPNVSSLPPGNHKFVYYIWDSISVL